MSRRRRFSHRRSHENLLLAISPDGKPVWSFKKLPDLPPPSRMVVGPDFLEIDEWIVPWRPLGKRMFKWILRQIDQWRKADRSEENAEQLSGILDALKSQFDRRPENQISEQGEFEL